MPESNWTAFHARFFALELTRRHPSDSLEKLTAILADAQVELNPHQIDAALFAFRSPLSKGAILADEVGLGKTIEAGLVISQKWAERRRQILVITPANLRKQWSQELAEKFFLPSVILEKSSFEKAVEAGNLNPFLRENEVVICSFQFARSKAAYLKAIEWHLAVIDEAHRLRNVWRPDNKMGRAIKTALADRPKILLTATPLQNTLLELYGLVSLIDDHVFGDLWSFRSQFSKIDGPLAFRDLKERLAPVCQRTLRKQVGEYINYTNRIPILQDFAPSEAEQRLYDFISEYLREEKLFALPASQRPLMTLIMRKLLASSTFAISGTLRRLAERLREIIRTTTVSADDSTDDVVGLFEENYDDVRDFLEEHREAEGRLRAEPSLENLRPTDEHELVDDWEMDDDEADDPPARTFSKAEIEAIKLEIERLDEYRELAESIHQNSKGEVLKIALEKGFQKLAELNAARKAIIFTESTRTQIYLKNLLENEGFAGEIVLFNGSNADADSRRIYKNWLKKHAGTDKISGSKTADARAAIVDFFRNEATIMIATEAAAEGINLQFCSLVVNYDLPWNPQRIEQRIGRCHRYGQKFDVVVVNFLNRQNEADVRVFELLDEKFMLFKGVFGASDEILGSIESGVDFEKRIAAIYQSCRSRAEIEAEFARLQQELAPDIEARMDDTRRSLLENFDEEVIEKLKISDRESRENLNRHDLLLWNLTRWFLRDMADFDEPGRAFSLRFNPFPAEIIHPGPYRLSRAADDEANRYRPGHPLAIQILEICKRAALPDHAVLEFRYGSAGSKISLLESRIGQAGWLRLDALTIEAFDVEEHLLFSAKTDDGQPLDPDLGRRLFSLVASILMELPPDFDETSLETDLFQKEKQLLAEHETRNARLFDTELDKLDRWAADCKDSLERELKDLDRQIGEAKSAARKALRLDEKVNLQRSVKDLEHRRNEKRHALYSQQDAIDGQKEKLFEEVQARLNRRWRRERVFLVRWRLV